MKVYCRIGEYEAGLSKKFNEVATLDGVHYSITVIIIIIALNGDRFGRPELFITEIMKL